MRTETSNVIKEVVYFCPKMRPMGILSEGQRGYIVTSIRNVSEVEIGDTITLANDPADETLPECKDSRSMVFSSVYPIEINDIEKLKSTLAKLQLNDASLVDQPESSIALGFGLRCGFLKLLHMYIV
jgi:GTP-binding protein LepA